MGNNFFIIWATQLVGQAPTLVVYVVGIALCGMFWRRSPAPAAWALAGLVLLLVSALGGPLVQNWILFGRGTGTPATASTGMNLAVIALVFSVVRAAGTALLLVGVFTAREPAYARAFEVSPATPATPPPLRR
jgi:hypothetical protein